MALQLRRTRTYVRAPWAKSRPRTVTNHPSLRFNLWALPPGPGDRHAQPTLERLLSHSPRCRGADPCKKLAAGQDRGRRMACLASNFSGRRNPPTPPRPPRGAKIAFQLPICRPELPQQQTRPHSAVSAWLDGPDGSRDWVGGMPGVQHTATVGRRNEAASRCNMHGGSVDCAPRAPSGAGGWLAVWRGETRRWEVGVGEWGTDAGEGGGHKAATPRIFHGDW